MYNNIQYSSVQYSNIQHSNIQDQIIQCYYDRPIRISSLSEILWSYHENFIFFRVRYSRAQGENAINQMCESISRLEDMFPIDANIDDATITRAKRGILFRQYGNTMDPNDIDHVFERIVMLYVNDEQSAESLYQALVSNDLVSNGLRGSIHNLLLEKFRNN